MYHNSPTKAAIAVGSNVASSEGSPQVSVLAAIVAVAQTEVSVVAQSALYSTPCMPAGAGPDFVNAAFIVETTLSPEALLAHLHVVEARFGRERGARWAARTMDLDLLYYGEQIVPDVTTWAQWARLDADLRAKVAPDQLILPHPRLQERGFVLVPLCEIAPDWVHPGFDKTTRTLCADLPASERNGPRQLDPAPS